MNACDAAALEALVAEELPNERSKSVMAHVMECEACRTELAALRDERLRFATRAHRLSQVTQAADAATWNRVAAALVPQRRTAPASARRHALSASAIAAVVCVALGFAGYTTLFHHTSPIGGEPIAVELKVQGSTAPKVFTPPRELRGKSEVPVRDLADTAWVVSLSESPKVAVKMVGGELTVSTTKTAQGTVRVHVDQGADSIDADWMLLVEEDAGTGLRVELRCKKSSCGAAPSLSLEVDVPARSTLQLDAVDADLTVHDIVGRQVARTVSGNVVLEGSGNVDVHTTSGTVEVTGVGGESRVESVSGDVQLTGACGAGCTRDITTVSGDVTLDTEDQASYLLHYKTVSGELSGDQIQDRGSGDLRIGQGEGRVSVKTVSGGLTLE